MPAKHSAAEHRETQEGQTKSRRHIIILPARQIEPPAEYNYPAAPARFAAALAIAACSRCCSLRSASTAAGAIAEPQCWQRNGTPADKKFANVWLAQIKSQQPAAIKRNQVSGPATRAPSPRAQTKIKWAVCGVSYVERTCSVGR